MNLFFVLTSVSGGVTFILSSSGHFVEWRKMFYETLVEGIN